MKKQKTGKVIDLKKYKDKKKKNDHFDAIEFAKRKLLEDNPNNERYF